MSVWDFGNLVDEAAEQARIAPDGLQHRHLVAAKRSLELMYIEIENSGGRAEYLVDTYKASLSASQYYLALPADTIDVMDVVYASTDTASSTTEYPLFRISRQDYMHQADKYVKGTPQAYWISKELPSGDPGSDYSSSPFADSGFGSTQTGSQGSDTDKLLVLWPGHDGTSDAYLRITRLRWHGDPAALDSDLDTRRNWYDTLVTGLAFRLCDKFGDEKRAARLEARWQSKLNDMDQLENYEPSVVRFVGSDFQTEATLSYFPLHAVGPIFAPRQSHAGSGTAAVWTAAASASSRCAIRADAAARPPRSTAWLAGLSRRVASGRTAAMGAPRHGTGSGPRHAARCTATSHATPCNAARHGHGKTDGAIRPSAARMKHGPQTSDIDPSQPRRCVRSALGI